MAELKSTPTKTGDLTNRDVHNVVNSYLRENDLRAHNVRSFNNFLREGIVEIIKEIFSVNASAIPSPTIKSPENQNINAIQINVKFTDVDIHSPYIETSFDNSVKTCELLPTEAIKRDIPYSAPLVIGCAVTLTAFMKDGTVQVRKEQINNLQITKIPIMVGCYKCHVSEYTPAQKMAIGMDPNDQGGYFILNSFWIINGSESRKFNEAHIFYNLGHKHEVTRLEFISKPDGNYQNSAEIKIILEDDGNVYVLINSIEYLKDVKFPFYFIFRVLGTLMDEEIFNMVVPGFKNPDDKVSSIISQQLREGFTAPVPSDRLTKVQYSTDIPEIIKAMCTYIYDQKNQLIEQAANDESETFGTDEIKNSESSKKIEAWTANLQPTLDKYLLPHMGVTPGDRHNKLRYLANLINKLYLVSLKLLGSTDRDALDNKRIFMGGVSYSRMFKAQFNLATVLGIKKALVNACQNTDFSKVEISKVVKSAIRPDEFEKAIAKAISTGDKISQLGGFKIQLKHRIITEQLNIKNFIYLVSAMRNIKTVTPNQDNKAGDRAKEIRAVHDSYRSLICVAQSADTGESVGLIKQMAIMAFISDYINTHNLRTLISGDEQIYKVNRTFPEQIYKLQLTTVMINGEWVGFCEKPFLVLKKYVELRRGYSFGGLLTDYNTPAKRIFDTSPIHPHITIALDIAKNELCFWTDSGRLMAPFIVIRNNGELDPVGREYFESRGMGIYDPYKNTGFIQDILLTKQHISDLINQRMTIKDLAKLGIIEYLAAEEIRQSHIAGGLDEVYANRNNPLRVYTHCEFSINMFGITALVSPLAHHIQMPRLTFETQQAKQTNGIPQLNYPYMIQQKHVLVQLYNDYPILKTIINGYIYPNGMNVNLGLYAHNGFNSEDSLTFNSSASDRGTLYCISYNRVTKTLDPGQTFGTPDQYSGNISSIHNYSKIDPKTSTVPPGTPIKKGDALIGVVSAIKRTGGPVKWKDSSIMYDGHEDACVTRVDTNIRGDGGGSQFKVVTYQNPRPLSMSDKLSSRQAQKGMTSVKYPYCSMPFSSNGNTITICMSPFAIPSRMTISQMYESNIAKLGALRGVSYDGTIFNNIDMYKIGEQLEARGYHCTGVEYCYDGMTGKRIQTPVFMGSVFYQRLMKFGVESIYSVNRTGSINPVTKQPVAGRNNDGGMRMGEMEKDCLFVSGCVNFLQEKFRTDSDQTVIYVCNTCKNPNPVVNEAQGTIICRICQMNRATPQIYKVISVWIGKTLIDYFNGCMIKTNVSINPDMIE